MDAISGRNTCMLCFLQGHDTKFDPVTHSPNSLTHTYYTTLYQSMTQENYFYWEQKYRPVNTEVWMGKYLIMAFSSHMMLQPAVPLMTMADITGLRSMSLYSSMQSQDLIQIRTNFCRVVWHWWRSVHVWVGEVCKTGCQPIKTGLFVICSGDQFIISQ